MCPKRGRGDDREKSNSFSFRLNDLTRWLESRPLIAGAFSPDAMREAVLILLTGGNYRTITERCVREKLFLVHAWLLDIAFEARKRWHDKWPEKLLEAVETHPRKEKILKDLHVWILGLTHKTAQNLGLRKNEPGDFAEFLSEMLEACNVVISQTLPSDSVRKMVLEKDANSKQEFPLDEALWFFQMVGSGTLGLRGSVKASFGKRLEYIFLRASLEMLGLEMNKNFWLRIGRDVEVARESDAEVETKRGRVRIDMGLIGTGNQEVTEDKLNRVGRNGIVVADMLGRSSAVLKTASNLGVKLVQIRHNLPLTEMYTHLRELVRVTLHEPETSRTGLERQLKQLSPAVFSPQIAMR